MNPLDTAKMKMQHGIDLGGRTVELNGPETAAVYLALESVDTLTIEAEHFKDTARSYGRVLQALAAIDGGEFRLELADMLNDSTMIVVEVIDEQIIVRLEETISGG